MAAAVYRPTVSCDAGDADKFGIPAGLPAPDARVAPLPCMTGNVNGWLERDDRAFPIYAEHARCITLSDCAGCHVQG